MSLWEALRVVGTILAVGFALSVVVFIAAALLAMAWAWMDRRQEQSLPPTFTEMQERVAAVREQESRDA